MIDAEHKLREKLISILTEVLGLEYKILRTGHKCLKVIVMDKYEELTRLVHLLYGKSRPE